MGHRSIRWEDKTRKSGREIHGGLPRTDPTIKLAANAQDIATTGLPRASGCHDGARVDMRLDEDGNLYILEINSLPSLGEHGSYVIAAEKVGLDFPALINRIVEVASSRYFGTPTPPTIHTGEKDPQTLIFSFLTERRDRIEKRLEEWTHISSRTSDPVGNTMAITQLDNRMQEMKMKPVKELTDTRSVLHLGNKCGTCRRNTFHWPY